MAPPLPSKSDPRWRELVTMKEVQSVELSTRILFTRLQLQARSGGESAIQSAVDEAREYFRRNPVAAGQDLQLAFGEPV
jgi:hypothetical protein